MQVKLVNKEVTGLDVVELARDWMGTPYKHQACLKHVGCDCIGLIRGIWKELYGVDAVKPPSYTPRWAEINPTGQEPMLSAAEQHLDSVFGPNMFSPGNVLLIRVRRRSAVKHCGIIGPNKTLIHAYDSHNVIEEPIRESWFRADLYAFSYKGVSN